MQDERMIRRLRRFSQSTEGKELKAQSDPQISQIYADLRIRKSIAQRTKKS